MVWPGGNLNGKATRSCDYPPSVSSLRPLLP